MWFTSYLNWIGCAYSFLNLLRSSLTTGVPLSIASWSSSVAGGSGISNLSISNDNNSWGLQNDLYVVKKVLTNDGSAYLWYVSLSISFRSVPPLINGTPARDFCPSSNTTFSSESSSAYLVKIKENYTLYCVGIPSRNMYIPIMLYSSHQITE